MAATTRSIIPNVSRHARQRAHQRIGGQGLCREAWEWIVKQIREGALPWKKNGALRRYLVPVRLGEQPGFLPVLWDPKTQVVVTVLDLNS